MCDTLETFPSLPPPPALKGAENEKGKVEGKTHGW